jgi:hypothetical protein
MKVAELDGDRLDYWVARASALPIVDKTIVNSHKVRTWSVQSPHGEPVWYSPSSDWTQGGPILEHERIDCDAWKNGMGWNASTYHTAEYYAEMPGATLLIAAMRCYVASKFGTEVPER